MDFFLFYKFRASNSNFSLKVCVTFVGFLSGMTLSAVTWAQTIKEIKEPQTTKIFLGYQGLNSPCSLEILEIQKEGNSELLKDRRVKVKLPNNETFLVAPSPLASGDINSTLFSSSIEANSTDLQNISSLKVVVEIEFSKTPDSVLSTIPLRWKKRVFAQVAKISTTSLELCEELTEAPQFNSLDFDFPSHQQRRQRIR